MSCYSVPQTSDPAKTLILCPICTYENQKQSKTCELCDTSLDDIRLDDMQPFNMASTQPSSPNSSFLSSRSASPSPSRSLSVTFSSREEDSDCSPYLPLPPATLLLNTAPFRPYGVGLLPLSVTYFDSPRPSPESASSILSAVHDAGLGFVDTADTYHSGDGEDAGYASSLVKSIPDPSFLVATKVGMRRSGTSSADWRTVKLRPSEIRPRVLAEIEALGVESLGLFSLHHVEHYTLLELESLVLSMKSCLDSGLTRSIGLCNVPLDALRHIHGTKGLPVHAVQNNYSVYNRSSSLPPTNKRTPSGNTKGPMRGVLLYCEENGIPFFPHGCLGGAASRYDEGKRGRRDLVVGESREKETG